MTHPRDMEAKQVKAFLTMLATERKVSASTHKQALSALLFVYREVLKKDFQWLTYAIKSGAAYAIFTWSTGLFYASICANIVFFANFNTVVPQD